MLKFAESKLAANEPWESVWQIIFWLDFLLYSSQICLQLLKWYQCLLYLIGHWYRFCKSLGLALQIIQALLWTDVLAWCIFYTDRFMINGVWLRTTYLICYLLLYPRLWSNTLLWMFYLHENYMMSHVIVYKYFLLGNYFLQFIGTFVNCGQHIWYVIC